MGRPFAETSAELIARHPEHRALIAAWGPRFSEQIPGPIAGMPELVAELDDASVPLYALTNFSGEFFAAFRAQEAAFFDRFRGIVVSGDERVLKPDPRIYRTLLDRYRLTAEDCLFVDDRAENVAGAQAVGMAAIPFEGAEALRQALVARGVLPGR